MSMSTIFFILTAVVCGIFMIGSASNTNKLKAGGKMISFIWAGMIIISILYMLLSGRGEDILPALTDSAAKAVEICISLAGIYCLWLGVMGIMEASGLAEKLSGGVKKLFRPIFSQTPENAFSLISMNITANMLGLGNAATPIGLKAMEALKSEERLTDTASDDMIMFIVLNTASLQLIPTTVISLRSSLGASSPGSIILPTLITTLISAVFGVMACKALSWRRKL